MTKRNFKKVVAVSMVAIGIFGGVVVSSSYGTAESSAVETAVFRVIDNITPEYTVNTVFLGHPFMATQDGGLVVPVSVSERTDVETTFVCEDGNILIVEGGCVVVEP